MLASIAVLLLLWFAATSLRTSAARLAGLMIDYEFLLAGIVMLHALLVVSKLRKKLSADHARSWLAAAPIARRDVGLSIALQIMAIATLHLSIWLMAIGTVVWLGTGANVMTHLMALTIAGFGSGALMAALLPGRERELREDSRYAPRLKAGAHQPRVSSRVLAHWPVAQVFAWHRPENLRIVILVVLFTVQGGSSMIGGLCVVSTWLLAIYLVTLLRATVHVGHEAARWLRSTPITFLNFAWPVARRSLVQQLIGAIAFGVLGVVLGSPVLVVCYLVALWIMAVALILTVSLACSYRSQRSAARLAFSLTGLAAIEMRAQGWSLPVVLLIIALHLRYALQAQRNLS